MNKQKLLAAILFVIGLIIGIISNLFTSEPQIQIWYLERANWIRVFGLVLAVISVIILLIGNSDDAANQTDNAGRGVMPNKDQKADIKAGGDVVGGNQNIQQIPFALIAFMTVVLLAIVIVVYLLSQNNRSSAIDSNSANSISTQQPQQPPPMDASETPMPEPTTSFVDRQAKAMILLDEARNWSLVFSDTFDNNQHTWPLEIDEDQFAKVTPAIENGQYRLDVTAVQDEGTVAWAPNPPTPVLTDFYAAVDVQKQTGPTDSRGGLLFRMDDQEQLYMFRVNGDEGNFAVVRMLHDQPDNSEQLFLILIELTPSTSIRKDANRLEVIGQGSRLYFFINGTYVGETEDTMLPQGKINPAVHIRRRDSASYTFDNLEIRQP